MGDTQATTEGHDEGAGRAKADPNRRAPRFPFRADVELAGAQNAAGTLLDISAGGACARLDRRLRVGRVATMIVRTPTDRVYRNSVQVVWTQAQDGAFVAGLQFI